MSGGEHHPGVRGVQEVYGWAMARTNIDIDDAMLEVVMRRYGIHTKTEAVDLALRRLAGQPMTIVEALEMRGAGAIGAVPADTGP